ncbi:MAG: sensor histidine kinase [Chloroflexota bacterium]
MGAFHNKTIKDPSGTWESFVGMWERANLIRSYFWNQRFVDEKVLLTHFLARLRRFFGVDFCYGTLLTANQKIVEVGQPEAGLSQLPERFSQRLMDLLANSSAPVSWHNDLSAGFGYVTTVVAPLTPPVGRSFGFLMLGHGRRKSYSPHELFLLQTLASELSWVVRDLATRQQHQRQLAATSHDVKNALQVIVGNAALIQQKFTNPLKSEFEKHIQSIESSVQQITDSINALSGLTNSADEEVEPSAKLSDEAVIDIASAISQSVESCRNAAKERGVKMEVVYAPNSPRNATLVPARFKRVLDALVDSAASATRDESVRLTVRREDGGLEVVVKGMKSNRVADRLKSLFEPSSRLEGAWDKSGERLSQVRNYLDHAGGDAYLKSRPGEAAEFIVSLPITSSMQPDRPKFRN